MTESDKQSRFVAEYMVDLNATQAAIRAGYSEKTARQIASELLSKPDIQAEVAALKLKQLSAADLSAVRVLEEMRRLAFSNLQDLFDEDGNLRPIKTLTREQAACIASLEVIKKNAEAGDGHVDTIHKLKVWDKTKTLELLAKHFALLTDVMRVDGSDLSARLTSGRGRVKP